MPSEKSKLDEKNKNKYKCLYGETCKDPECTHKEEHEQNCACTQHCIYSNFGKTCVIVERKPNESRPSSNKTGRVSNPRLPKRTMQEKASKKRKSKSSSKK